MQALVPKTTFLPVNGEITYSKMHYAVKNLYM